MMFVLVYFIFADRITIFTFLGLLPYLLFAIIVFFLPLSSAHDVMAKEKKEELKRLSREFNKIYANYREYVEDSSSNNSENKRQTIEYMENITALYKHVEDMAVWPFDISIFTRFFITIGLPFVLIGIQILIETFIM